MELARRAPGEEAFVDARGGALVVAAEALRIDEFRFVDDPVARGCVIRCFPG